MSMFLDASLIPSLPPPGGSVSHADLMGRPRLSPSPGSSGTNIQPLPGLPLPNENSSLRPQLIKRSSSFEDRPRGNRAGVGAVGLGASKSNETKLNPALIRIGHGRNWSTSSVGKTDEGIRPSPRPGLIRKASSLDEDLPRVSHERSGSALVRSKVTTSRGKRSDLPRGAATSSAEPPKKRINPPPQTKAASAPPAGIGLLEGCIKLGATTDQDRIAKLLTTLVSLIPPSRITALAPPPQTCLLHPTTLITPLAVILEALVVEREVLRGSHPPTSRLPALRDGSAFQLDNGDGELDWRVVKTYVLAVGGVLRSLLSYLRGNTEGKTEVEEAMRQVRQYVSKMKKVFGEVAGMYVEGYGFVRGWWDEGGMKAAAGEVGRWGDVFDA